MRTTRRPRAAAILLAVLLTASVPALAGCGLLEGVIENATGGDVDLGGSSVPEDFPADVPLIDGEVVTGAGIGNADGRIWNVTVKVSGPEALDEIAAELEAAGFTRSEVATDGGATFTKDPYGVLVVVAEGGDGWVANYTVTQSTQ